MGAVGGGVEDLFDFGAGERVRGFRIGQAHHQPFGRVVRDLHPRAVQAKHLAHIADDVADGLVLQGLRQRVLKPFITQILPHGLSLPRVPKGDQVWQHSEACQQRVDAGGNWLRQTDGKIRGKAIEREVEALDNTEAFQNHTRTVDDHSTEFVGGIKKLEALGALKLLSGGSAGLVAVDDLHQATGRDLNVFVGQKHNAIVSGDMHEKIQGLRQSVAGRNQRLIAPKNHVGSETVNIFTVLVELIDVVQNMNEGIAVHVHGSSPTPSNALVFASDGAKAISLNVKLRPISA